MNAMTAFSASDGRRDGGRVFQRSLAAAGPAIETATLRSGWPAAAQSAGADWGRLRTLKGPGDGGTARWPELRVLVVLGVLAVALAGCGGSSTPLTGGGTPLPGTYNCGGGCFAAIAMPAMGSPGYFGYESYVFVPQIFGAGYSDIADLQSPGYISNGLFLYSTQCGGCYVGITYDVTNTSLGYTSGNYYEVNAGWGSGADNWFISSVPSVDVGHFIKFNVHQYLMGQDTFEVEIQGPGGDFQDTVIDDMFHSSAASGYVLLEQFITSTVGAEAGVAPYLFNRYYDAQTAPCSHGCLPSHPEMTANPIIHSDAPPYAGVFTAPSPGQSSGVFWTECCTPYP
jgi:hypothetical protein